MPKFTVVDNVNHYLRKKPEYKLLDEGKGGIKALGLLGCQQHTEERTENGETGVLLGRLSLRYPGTMQVMMHQVSCEG